MPASWKSPNLLQPQDGNQAISRALDFSAAASIPVDLTPEALEGRLDFIQSVYIDNADNPSFVDLTFDGAPISQRIRCPAFAQGWFPVSAPVGSFRFTGACSAAVTVNIILANYAMPYLEWEPGSAGAAGFGNVAVNALALGIGNTTLVAAVAGQAVKLFRGMISVDGATILKFTDGAAGTVLFAVNLAAGGSVNFSESATPWMTTSVGNALVINSSAAVNAYGGIGYNQT